MSLALVHSRAQVGVQAPAVSVETHLANGLPHLTLVGLPETTVKESKDRVRSAIVNSGLDYPARRITQNLAPADLPKDGGRYDLAIALGILAASGQVPVAPSATSSAWASSRCPGNCALCRACCRRRWRQGMRVGHWWYHAKTPKKPALQVGWWCMPSGTCWNWSPT